MNISDMGSLASIIAIPIAIIGLILTAKYTMNKYKKTVHSDNSIKIGNNNKISDSFNKKD